MEERYLDLLIVDCDGSMLVAEAESSTVHIGDLVELGEARKGLAIRGEVVAKMWTQEGDERYLWVSKLHEIHSVSKVWHLQK